jgi:cellulose synthase/poly-beta-1,6-N-acetylglucosamine synthase-like glycosyltransferase
MVAHNLAAKSSHESEDKVAKNEVLNSSHGILNKVSVVIVNKNERMLSDTLDALEASVGHTIDEVLVVDASSGALDDIRVSHEWARWIDYTQPEGLGITIAHQRNLGVREAIGDVIVFTDSGCLPEEGWLERLLTPILSGGETVSCGPAKALGKSVYSGAHGSSRVVNVDYVPMAATINLAFRRQAFDAVGGFDETFGSAEDIDFTWRLNDCGFRIRWVQDAVVGHDYGTPTRQLRRAYFYGKGECRLLRKHYHRIGEAATQNSVPIVYALFLLGLPLTVKWRWYPLLLLWPIWRLRNEEVSWLVLLDHIVMGAGVLHELARPGT